MVAPHSPLPPTVADRDAEIAALQTAFDEYIASSRELEDELDAELAKMQEKLAESSAANAALIAQLESLNPQLSSLEKALQETKQKLETEASLRRDAELLAEDLQSKTREVEGSLEKLNAENEELREQLVFREEEVEEMRLELEVEKERHSVELEELAAQLNGKKDKDGAKSQGLGSSSNHQQAKDDISVMTEEDFVTMQVGSNDENLVNDQNDYIKRLEDELEDVTEQLIEAETKISEMEGKLSTSEKTKFDLETKISKLEGTIEELKLAVEEATKDKISKADLDHSKDAKEELALLTEELNLTQEELKAAEEDARNAIERLESAQAKHKEEIANLKKQYAEADSINLQLDGAMDEKASLLMQISNLNQALANAKADYEKASDEIDALRAAYDEAGDNIRAPFVQREEELIKEHQREIEELKSELQSYQNISQAYKDSSEKASGLSAEKVVRVELQAKLDSKTKEVERLKSELKEERDQNIKSKRKIEELSAGSKALIDGALVSAPKSRSEIVSSSIQTDFDLYEASDDNTSDFYRSHARSRSRIPHEHSKRARSSSPTTVVRLEREVSTQINLVKKMKQETEKLESQKRMSDVRVGHLEADVIKLRQEIQRVEENSESLVTAAAMGAAQNPETRDDKDIMDVNVDQILQSGDMDEIGKEFKSIVRKATLQKEHNAQLLVKILKLQGNIQVFCRIRPLTKDEIASGVKRAVEALSEESVGIFDERTKMWNSFNFDKVWGPDSHQFGVFQDVEPLALSVVDGYNACIFAYGQTGSGKTFTMEGTEGPNRGISFRTIEKVFNLLKYRQMKQDVVVKQLENSGHKDEQQGRFKFEIDVGMLEIYNDNVHDLLVPTKKGQKKEILEIRRNKEGKVEVSGLHKEKVNSVKDVLALLKRGNQNRATASTDMNEHSSRSHMVLIVDVKSGIEGEEPSEGTLFLVDLAGSERVKKSGVEGANLKEAAQINQSLSALGNVMEALDRKASHIPYRDSKLTFLLQDSLGGNSRTMMIVAVDPTASSYDETNHALKFATRVRRINIGSAQQNVSSKNLEETVKQLSTELKHLSMAKKKSEEQFNSLKKDHKRIQDRLKGSATSRAKAQDEGRTLAVLKTSNAQMTERWQKEKRLHETAVEELEAAKSELRKVEGQLTRANREIERLTNAMSENEAQQKTLREDMRSAKAASSAATLRARKAQMLLSRPSNASTGISKPTHRSEVSSQLNVDPVEAREKVLEMLKKNDPKKVDKIDAIMERFKGREGFLLVKMAARYEGNGNTVKASQEMAMAKHMERMRSNKSMSSR